MVLERRNFAGIGERNLILRKLMAKALLRYDGEVNIG
jgi:hypothetical protein